MNEKCWFIFGKKVKNTYIGWLKYSSEGNPASVSFNWSDAAKRNLLGFHHTHPDGCLWFSSRDDKTMKAWVRAEGRPLICSVRSSGKDAAAMWKRMEDRSVGHTPLHVTIKGNLFLAWESNRYK